MQIIRSPVIPPNYNYVLTNKLNTFLPSFLTCLMSKEIVCGNFMSHNSFSFFLCFRSIQQIMKRPTQNQLSRPIDKIKAYEFIPAANITTFAKLHASIYSPKTQKKAPKEEDKQQQKIFASPNIELSSSNPNTLIFHNYQKYNPFNFQFNHIYDQNTKPSKISTEINLYRSIIEQNKDLCVMVMGNDESGVSQLCESDQIGHKQQGLIYQLISTLWNKLQQVKNEDSIHGINSVTMNLKIMAIEDDKLYDLLSPKHEATLKDLSGRVIIGCTIFQIMSIYDLHTKLSEIFHQKRLLHSDSILLVHLQVTISRQTYLITDSSQTTRYFNFIQWYRQIPKANRMKQHNQQSLLTLNMCIYQLYKISCHNPEKIMQNQIRQLWAHFRNSYITMLIKPFLMGGNRMVFISCVSLQENQEQDNYQVLMMAKNISKINLSKLCEYFLNLPFSSPIAEISEQRVKKMKTEPVQSHSFESSPSPNLKKLKQNLQRILKEKELSEEKHKQEEIVGLFKEQKQRRRELENVRYKRQQIKIREDYNKLHKITSHSRLINNNEQSINLPPIPQKRMSTHQPIEQQLSRLAKEEQTLLKRIGSLHFQIMGSIEQQPNPKMGRNVLQMQVKLHEKEMVDYVSNKNKILSLLKNQIRELKIEQGKNKMNQHPIKSQTHKRKIKSRSQLAPHPTIQLQDKQQSSYNPENSSFPPENQSMQRQEERFDGVQEDVRKQQQKIFKLQTLKKMNKNNYLFEKRRLLLKAKLSKGREELNQFYNQAAQKFQQYKASK